MTGTCVVNDNLGNSLAGLLGGLTCEQQEKSLINFIKNKHNKLCRRCEARCIFGGYTYLYVFDHHI